MPLLSWTDLDPTLPTPCIDPDMKFLGLEGSNFSPKIMPCLSHFILRNGQLSSPIACRRYRLLSLLQPLQGNFPLGLVLVSRPEQDPDLHSTTLRRIILVVGPVSDIHAQLCVLYFLSKLYIVQLYNVQQQWCQFRTV
jgi:hypothetical protein